MSVNSRRKGKRGELEWADYLRGLGFSGARRGQQYHGLEGEDVVGGIPETHCEVKRTEQLSLYKAMAQAVQDADDLVPYVAHRRSRKDWLIVLRAQDLRRLAALVYDGERHAEKQTHEGHGSEPGIQG